MHEEPTSKQLAFLKRLKYSGEPPRSKYEASVLIDASKLKQAKAREEGKDYSGLTTAQAAKALEKSQAAWLKERRAEIRDQVKEDLAVQRDFIRDMKGCGEIDRDLLLAGWILHIGKECIESRHLDGLIVTVEDAKSDPGLLPPYDTCRADNCECDIDSVDRHSIPPGTRIAERADKQANESASIAVSNASAFKAPMVTQTNRFRGTKNNAGQSKSGCLSMVVLGSAITILLYRIIM